MKEIVKQEPVMGEVIVGYKEKTKYVSNDGKEFYDKKDCEKQDLKYLWDTKIEKTEKQIYEEFSSTYFRFYFCENFDDFKALFYKQRDILLQDYTPYWQKHAELIKFPQYIAIDDNNIIKLENRFLEMQQEFENLKTAYEKDVVQYTSLIEEIKTKRPEIFPIKYIEEDV